MPEALYFADNSIHLLKVCFVSSLGTRSTNSENEMASFLLTNFSNFKSAIKMFSILILIDLYVSKFNYSFRYSSISHDLTHNVKLYIDHLTSSSLQHLHQTAKTPTPTSPMPPVSAPVLQRQCRLPLPYSLLPHARAYPPTDSHPQPRASYK